MLKGKTVILGVTGSIAAYKAANVASMIIKLHADVHVIMTKNAANFIHPCTFETLTGNRCIMDTFDPDTGLHVPHIALAEKADLCLIAPASANIIAKLAYGLADDMLSTTVLAMTCPVLVSPAMNTNMFMNPVVQENLKKLAAQGKQIIQPAAGRLACLLAERADTVIRVCCGLPRFLKGEGAFPGS
jgi:phosphopantothenoylcysteine decarboxylase/phosphopantothenate--cysteine ligase